MSATAIGVVDARASAGESPVWSVVEQCLWWVDIWERRLHRYDPAARADRAIAMPDIVSFAAPHELGGLAVGLRAGVWHFVPARNAFSLIAELPLPETSRLNDAAIDPHGRIWVGSMATSPSSLPDGALWRIDVDGRVERMLDGLHSPNGLAFAPDGRTLYLSDSHPSVRTVWVRLRRRRGDDRGSPCVRRDARPAWTAGRRMCHGSRPRRRATCDSSCRRTRLPRGVRVTSPHSTRRASSRWICADPYPVTATISRT